MSSKSSPGGARRSPFVLEPKLLPRVLAYLTAHDSGHSGNEAGVRVEDIVDHLRSKHPEYSRKPYNPFLKQVSRLCEQQRDRAKKEAAAASVSGGEAGGGGVEAGEADEAMEVVAEDDDDEVEVIEPADKNLVNSSMRALYKSPLKPALPSAAATTASAAVPTLASTTTAPATQPTVASHPIAPSAASEVSSSSSVPSSVNPKKRKKYRSSSSSTLSATYPSASSSSSADSWQPTFISPSLSYSDLGGLSSTLQDLRELIHYPLLHPELYSHLGLSPPSGVLLHGPAGCGKSMLSQAIAGEVSRMGGVRCISISGPEVVGGVSGESEGRVRKLFDEARRCAPCVLLIDEIDAITGKREQAQREMERRIVAQLLTEMDNLQPKRRRAVAPPAAVDDEGEAEMHDEAHKLVIVIGATNRPDSLDPALRRAGRFDREIALHLPDEKAREEILRVMCREMRVEAAVDWKEIAKKAVGYVGADLSALTKEAAVIAVNRIFRQLQVNEAEERKEGEQQPMEQAENTATNGHSQAPSVSRQQQSLDDLHHRTQASSRLELYADPLPPALLASLSILHSDFQAALKKVQPSAKREGFSSTPDVSWNDIGALNGLHEELSLLVLQPILCPEQFEAIGLTSPAGVLLYGPPGCGKTLVARAIAGESGASFLSVKGPELLNLFVGESERAVRRVFERARASAPCVIFFDELDALCPRRGAGSGAGGGGGEGSNVSERVVNQLLTEMDGLEGRGRVFVIGATNRPDMIDAAMLRPGRLEKLIYVPLPTQPERESILVKHMRHCPLKQPDEQHKAQLIARIAADRRSDRLSGADLAALVREATIAALKAVQRQRWAAGPAAVVAGEVLSVEVDWQHFDTALDKVRPSVSVEAERRYEKMSKTLRRARATLTDTADDKYEDKRQRQEELTKADVHTSNNMANDAAQG